MQNCKGIAYENSLSFVGTNDIKTLIDRHKGNEISDILFIFASASISCIIPILTNHYSPQHLNSFATRELRSTILEQKYNSSTCHCFQINLPKFSILLSNPKLSQIIIRDTWTSIFIYVPRLSLSPVPSRSPSGVQVTTREQREKETKKEENAPRVFYRS